MHIIKHSYKENVVLIFNVTLDEGLEPDDRVKKQHDRRFTVIQRKPKHKEPE